MSASRPSRRDDPWLLIEFLAVARWIRDGDHISTIARRLRRPIPQVRGVIFGGEA